jgi:hypothetical protein
MHRLLEADKTLSAIVGKLGAGASTPFMDAYNPNVGLPIGSKKNKAQSDKQGDVADDEWEAVCYHRSARYSATDAEALAMGIVNKNGLGDGRGLGLAGGTEFVLSVLEFETDLTAADIVSAARSAISDLANEAVRDAGAATGITSGRGGSCTGGICGVAAAAAFPACTSPAAPSGSGGGRVSPAGGGRRRNAERTHVWCTIALAFCLVRPSETASLCGL